MPGLARRGSLRHPNVSPRNPRLQAGASLGRNLAVVPRKVAARDTVLPLCVRFAKRTVHDVAWRPPDSEHSVEYEANQPGLAHTGNTSLGPGGSCRHFALPALRKRGILNARTGLELGSRLKTPRTVRNAFRAARPDPASSGHEGLQEV